MKFSRYPLLLVTPLLSLAAPAFAQDAGTAPAATTAAPAASTAAPASTPPPASNPPPSSAPAAAPAAAGDDAGQKQDGFVFETHMYAQLVNFGAGVGAVSLPLMTGGIFGGYKLDRLILGLGFDFTSYDAPGSGGAQITMRWAPGVRYDLVRSSDDRAALFGQLDLSIGHDFGRPQANELIGADLGLGVRYWLHRQVAIAGVGGWNSSWTLTQSPDSSAVLMGIFAGVQILGVF